MKTTEQRIMNLEKESQDKRMRVDNQLPSDKDGYDGERRIVKISKRINNQDQDMIYHTMKVNGKWQKSIGGIDMEEDTETGELRLITYVGTQKYKIALEAVT